MHLSSFFGPAHDNQLVGMFIHRCAGSPVTVHIRGEIAEMEAGQLDREGNALKHAP
ncbi:MAG: hypothetical protein R3C53_08910 [Pirellulaceae bacterium]